MDGARAVTPVLSASRRILYRAASTAIVLANRKATPIVAGQRSGLRAQLTGSAGDLQRERLARCIHRREPPYELGQRELSWGAVVHSYNAGPGFVRLVPVHLNRTAARRPWPQQYRSTRGAALDDLPKQRW